MLESLFSPSKNLFDRDLQFTFCGRRRQHLRSWTRSQCDVWIRPNNLEARWIVLLAAWRDEIDGDLQNFSGVSVVLVQSKRVLMARPPASPASLHMKGRRR